MNLPANFDLRAIQIFVVTAEQGGMTQSAKILGMTQSAVSQTIASLEGAIGTNLFDRSVRPIVLTSTGNDLLERGRKLLNFSLDAYREASKQEKKKYNTLTIAMPDSLASLVSAPLMQKFKGESSNWRIWAGMSPFHREDFLSQSIDILVTTLDALDDVTGLERYPVISEPYVMIFPKDYEGPTDLSEDIELDLMRFSLRSSIGRRIEAQLNRLRLNFAQSAEFDSAPGHMMAVAQGLGWGITTPICILQRPSLLDQLKVVPLNRGQFHRQFILTARNGSMECLPERVAENARKVLTEEYMPQLAPKMPWLEELISTA